MKRLIAWTAPLGLLAAALTWSLGRADDKSPAGTGKNENISTSGNRAPDGRRFAGSRNVELTRKLRSEWKLKGEVINGRADDKLTCSFDPKLGAASNCRFRFLKGIRIDAGSVDGVNLAGAKAILAADVVQPGTRTAENTLTLIFDPSMSAAQKAALAKVLKGLLPISWGSESDDTASLNLGGDGLEEPAAPEEGGGLDSTSLDDSQDNELPAPSADPAAGSSDDCPLQSGLDEESPSQSRVIEKSPSLVACDRCHRTACDTGCRERACAPASCRVDGGSARDREERCERRSRRHHRGPFDNFEYDGYNTGFDYYEHRN